MTIRTVRFNLLPGPGLIPAPSNRPKSFRPAAGGERSWERVYCFQIVAFSAPSIQQVESYIRLAVPHRLTAYGFAEQRLSLELGRMPKWVSRFKRIWIENDEHKPVSIEGLETLLNGINSRTRGNLNHGSSVATVLGGAEFVLGMKRASFKQLLPYLLGQNGQYDELGLLIELYSSGGRTGRLVKLTPLNPKNPYSAWFNLLDKKHD